MSTSSIERAKLKAFITGFLSDPMHDNQSSSSLTAEVFRIALASLEAQAVAWDYERASCITCEGPQGFKRVIEHEYPPEWAIEEGRARNIVPLYAAPPSPVSVPDERAELQGADGTLISEDTKRVGELVMWVKRLAHSLRKTNPDSKLQNDAMDYLSRKGLIGVEDILR